MLELRAVSRTQGNNSALKSGSIAVPGVHLAFEEVPVLVHAFRRMVREVAYDVCEMAITTYLCARHHGRPFTALPVFLARGLHHGAVVSNPERGARAPEDLAGASVGVSRGYTVTTGVWARAILADEYGLDLAGVTWRPSGDEHVQEYVAPGNVSPLPAGSDLIELVVSGELAAAVGVTEDEHPALRSLIPDADGAARASLLTRGRYPINHLIVVRDDVLEANPELARDLFDAFVRSKEVFLSGLATADPEVLPAPDRSAQEVLRLTGEDPFPYGIAPNRAVLDDLLRHVVAQGILPDAPRLEDLFAAGTLDLVG